MLPYEAGENERRRETDDDAGKGKRESLAQNKAQDVGAVRTESETNADFLVALCD